MQAGCHALEARGAAVVHPPLAALRDAPPDELLAGLEVHALVCLDDADAVAGLPGWEEALFHLYNRCGETGCRLPSRRCRRPRPAFASPICVRACRAVSLSRLRCPMTRRASMRCACGRATVAWCWTPRWHASSGRAASVRWALIAVLDCLDTASLGAGRRLSIPFVKDVMGW